MFLEMLEEEYSTIAEHDQEVLDFLIGEDELTPESIAEAFDLGEEESMALYEQIIKTVDSSGTVTRKISRNIRSRRAALTTGISKSKLKLRARKAARTKKQNPMIGVRALRKRRKALRRRKQMGLK